MRSHDLRNVGDLVRLLAFVGLHLQLNKHITGMFVPVVLTLVKMMNKRGGRGGRSVYLLSGTVRLVQIDGDLTLTGAERVHREHGGTQHPVPRRFNTCRGTRSVNVFDKLYITYKG